MALLAAVSEIPPAGRLAVYCAGGHRSSIAASLIPDDVHDLLGGYSAWPLCW